MKKSFEKLEEHLLFGLLVSILFFVIIYLMIVFVLGFLACLIKLNFIAAKCGEKLLLLQIDAAASDHFG